MKHVISLLLRFLGGMSLYHLIFVFFVFWIGFISAVELAFFREVFWLLIALFLFLSASSHVKKDFFRRWWYEIWLVVLLSLWAVGYSLYLWVSFSDLLIWYKYDIYFFVIALSAVAIWYVWSRSTKKDMRHFEDSLYIWIAALLVGGLLYQWLKIVFPEIFMHLWYWPIGDYIVASEPPLWYRTWPWWIMRFQWLFSWPNNYWYFLVWIASFFTILSERQLRKSDSRVASWAVIGVYVLFLLSVLFTFSRGAYLWLIVQLCLFLLLFFRKYIKHKALLFSVWLWALVLFFWAIILLQSLKAWSNVAHMSAWLEWWNAFVANPLWYGLWSSGPSIHHAWTYLPESQFLQIFLDIWVVWFLFWIMAWKVLLTPVISYILKQKNHKHIPVFVLLWFWLIGLMFEGFFLHVREDSMVNYLLLVPYWIFLWYYQEH